MNEMKILINHCYGGFSFSRNAIIEYIKRRNIKCFIYAENVIGTIQKTAIEELATLKSYTSVWYSMTDVGETMTTKEFFDKIKKQNTLIFSDHKKYRTDKTMIELYEEYGTEWISGSCAKLMLEIVDYGDLYKIINHDGYESLDIIYTEEEYGFAAPNQNVLLPTMEI